MAKIIRLTAKNGAIKEIPFVDKFKLDPQFVGAKVEVIDSVTGAWMSAVKVHIRGKNVDLSNSQDAQPDEAKPEDATESEGCSGKDGSKSSDLDTGDTGDVGASAQQQPKQQGQPSTDSVASCEYAFSGDVQACRAQARTYRVGGGMGITVV